MHAERFVNHGLCSIALRRKIWFQVAKKERKEGNGKELETYYNTILVTAYLKYLGVKPVVASSEGDLES